MAMLLDAPAFTDSTDRGPSHGLWKDAPTLSALRDDPSRGWFFDDDFDKFTAASSGITSDWISTLVGTTPTMLLSKQGDTAFSGGGWLTLSVVGTSANDGINLQRPGNLFRPAAGFTIWGEISLNVLTTATPADLFFGLATLDTTVIASNALAIGSTTTTNYVGLSSVTGDGVVLLSSGKAATVTTKACTTLVAATTVKLGFKIKGVSEVTSWVNGVKSSASVATANIPITGMTPTIVLQNHTTTACIALVDFVRIIQAKGEQPAGV